jgi:hypothetical protein
MKALRIFRSAPILRIESPDRPGQEDTEHGHDQHPGDWPLARHDGGERKPASVELLLVVGNGLRPLDVDGDVLGPHLLRDDAQLKGTDADGAADGDVDLAELGRLAVDRDGEAGFGRHAEPRRRDLLDRGVVEGDRQVVQPDVAIGIATDLEKVVTDP